jgi:hypothetical protein
LCRAPRRSQLAKPPLNGVRQFFSDPFAAMDFLVVLLDVVVLVASDAMGAAGGSTKALRTVRLVRLVRLAKIARLAKAVRAAKKPKPLLPWKLPIKYARPRPLQMTTTCHLVTVLIRLVEADRCFRLRQAVSAVYGTEAPWRRRYAEAVALARSAQSPAVAAVPLGGIEETLVAADSGARPSVKTALAGLRPDAQRGESSRELLLQVQWHLQRKRLRSPPCAPARSNDTPSLSPVRSSTNTWK